VAPIVSIDARRCTFSVEDFGAILIRGDLG
jgi:hypothetical protein